MTPSTFFRFTDWFIPPDAKLDTAALSRSRIFIFTHLFGPLMAQSISIYLYLADPAPGLHYWVIVSCVSAFWILPFALKLTQKLGPLAIITVQNLTFVTLFGSYEYGGVSSPFLPWLLIDVLLGFFYLGERPLLLAALFTANLFGFFVAYAVSGGFPQHIPLEQLSTVGIISVCSATIYMSTMAIYYVNIVAARSHLEREVQRHRDTAVELRRAKEAAERASRQKSVFLAKMSHELRTPLNAVIGYSEILLEDAQDNAGGGDERVADVKRIHTAGSHLLALVNDVLDLSKVEAGRMEVEAAPIDIGRFIAEVVSTAQSLVGRNRNELRVTRAAGLGAMIGDATKLRQVLLNLLSNAAKFTRNGHIGLAVRRERADERDWITFAVSDTGIGIDGDMLAKLFTAFTQAGVSIRNEYGGTGLGLALSRGLCRLMGGDIAVDSELGRGSCFTVRVPAAGADDAALTAAPALGS